MTHEFVKELPRVARDDSLKGYFITGTDTNIGKTYVAVRLIKYLQQQNFTVVGVKPLSSDAVKTETGLQNDDAIQLQNASSIQLPYSYINPICYEPPIAPHIAAQQLNEKIVVADLMQKCTPVFSLPNINYFIVEGVGGWQMPLNKNETMADFAAQLNLPVILVVGMRLGCLNHTLLTYESILQKKVKFAGWIANCVDPNMLCLQENILTLKERIMEPLLGVVEFGALSSRTNVRDLIDWHMSF